MCVCILVCTLRFPYQHPNLGWGSPISVPLCKKYPSHVGPPHPDARLPVSAPSTQIFLLAPGEHVAHKFPLPRL